MNCIWKFINFYCDVDSACDLSLNQRNLLDSTDWPTDYPTDNHQEFRLLTQLTQYLSIHPSFMETLERRISSSSSSSWLPSKKWAIDLVSGLAGGFLSVSVCAPLDIARTRLNMMVASPSSLLLSSFLWTFILHCNCSTRNTRWRSTLDSLMHFALFSEKKACVVTTKVLQSHAQLSAVLTLMSFYLYFSSSRLQRYSGECPAVPLTLLLHLQLDEVANDRYSPRCSYRISTYRSIDSHRPHLRYTYQPSLGGTHKTTSAIHA